MVGLVGLAGLVYLVGLFVWSVWLVWLSGCVSLFLVDWHVSFFCSMKFGVLWDDFSMKWGSGGPFGATCCILSTAFSVMWVWLVW